MNTAELDALVRVRYAQEVGNGPRYVCAAEVRNSTSFRATRSCDMMVMDTWESGPVRLMGFELKVTRADWVHEMQQPEKSAAFIPFVSEWWLVVGDRKIVRDGELPAGWGLLAPAGDTLRVVVSAAREAVPAVPMRLVATLMRSVHRYHRLDAERARRKPFTATDYPKSNTYDSRYTSGYPYRKLVLR